jgi:4-hydroxythreonine-4-phosphate dehydrogenase
MNRAAKILKNEIKYKKINEPTEANFEIGTIDIMETGNYETDLIVFGKIQEVAGRMSIDWILKSVDLGIAGKIDGVSTCPINKRAIKLAGVKQDGHTEIYQEETHSPYALTMFSCRKLRVFMLSRHMSLVNACQYVTKERVLDILAKIDRELRQAGFENPLIAVAALNPHAGDGGLFGTEEITHLIPAVDAAQANGINAVGPIPADSVFHIGESGKYDAILSLYHDQAHIACKTLDFDKSITITFGLPFLRSSVDHGTAFDIAGKGIASSISLIESTKVLAEYAAKKMKKDR